MEPGLGLGEDEDDGVGGGESGGRIISPVRRQRKEERVNRVYLLGAGCLRCFYFDIVGNKKKAQDERR